MGTIKTTNIETITGSGTLTLGQSGETVTIPSGATLDLSNATQTGVGGTNTPAFLAYANANQSSIPANTFTKATNYGVEVFDTDNTFSSNRFTPGVSGKYFIFATVYMDHVSDQRSWVAIYKNGGVVLINADNPGSTDNHPIQVCGVVESDTDDYFEVFVRQSGTGTTLYSSGTSVRFGAYKIIE
jgi:hypothetical protein